MSLFHRDNLPPGRRTSRRRELIFGILVFAALILSLFFTDIVRSNLGLGEKDVSLGATFSGQYAAYLGLDWRTAYLAALDDIGIRHWRLPAYWDDLEPEPDVYDFSTIDWQVNEVTKRGGSVILAIGRKLPRWPECRVPKWAVGYDEQIIRTRLLAMIQEVVKHYRDNPTIAVWQIENEPFFSFGLCPPADVDLLKQEIALVRTLDRRPIMITESGELSTWVRAASLADILGISTYRVVWSKFIGYFYWPITPAYYRTRAEAVGAIVPKVIISEFQAEPWVSAGDQTAPLNRQLQLMTPERLRSNVIFARRVGFPEAYFWGVEWWYWLKQQGHPEMWAEAKKLFQEYGTIQKK